MLGSKMTKSNEYYIIEPVNAPQASVIWLHGLGADGKDFMGMVDDLGLPAEHGVRFIFPNAPFMNITVNYGMLMRGWYDIYDFNMLHKEDEVGIKKSRAQIEKYIQHENELGIPSNKIILGGFSQGGAMSLYTGLRLTQRLAGIISLSAYMPMAPNFVAQHYASNRNTPIFMAHGLFDPVVPYNLGQATRDLLKDNAYDVEWFSYPMQHTVCVEEIQEISSFMHRCLGYA